MTHNMKHNPNISIMLMKLFASHDVEDSELPSLDISDTSNTGSAVEVSARGDISSSDEEVYRPRRKHSHCDADDADNHSKQSSDYDNGRRRRGHRHRRGRGEGEASDGIIDLSTRSDGRCFNRRNSRSLSPPARAERARRSLSTPSHARFSYSSRRSSLGGTTVYRTAYMASLDAYLNTTSGLRLQPDGKCTFSFERRRIVINCAAPEEGGDGDYTLYLCIGPMKELQVKFRSKNLLKLVASWNEELKQRCQRRQRQRSQDTPGNDDIPSSGLLQIDSTKPGDANVAFIYYGHVQDIMNAAHFQSTLDDFVDDALYLDDRINNERKPDVIKNRNYDRHQQHNLTRSLPSFHTENDYDRSELRRGNNTSRRQTVTVCKSPPVSKSPPVAEPAPTTFDTSNNDVSNANETDMENSSKSIFSRMISSWRSKSGEISFSPFVGLGNQEQDCYVVDRHAVEAGTVKTTIVLNRVGAGGGESEKSEDGATEERQLTIRRADEFRRRDCSRPRRGDDQRIDAYAGNRCDRPRQRRSITVDSDVDDRDERVRHRQSTRQSSPSRPHRKSAVFIADDYSDRNQYAHSRRRT